VGRKELGCPLTGAREAVRRPGDSGKGGGGQNSDAEHAEAREWGNGGEDECGEWGGASSLPFYMVGGGAAQPGIGGERVAEVVHHNGMKAAVLEENRLGWWWGVMRSRCSGRYGRGGGAGRQRART
jgi:hypothetical protein